MFSKSFLKYFVFILGVCFFLPCGIKEAPATICLTLGDALERASNVNLQVMMSNARLEQAIARIAESRADLLPHVDGTVSGARQTTDLRYEGLNIPIPGFSTHEGPYNNFDARGQITMSLFDPGAFERFQAAKKGENLSEAQMQKTREDVLALVANLFIDAQRKDQTFKLMKTILERDQLDYEVIEQEYTQGTGAEIDFNKAKSNLDETKYLYKQAQVQAKEALLDLEAALQMPLGESLVFLDDKVLIRKMNKAAANFENASNADMAVASSQLQEAQADKNTAMADFLPKVSGTANYGRSGESPSQSSNTYFVGAQVSVPIWEGGQTQAQLKESKAQVKEAQENLQDTAQQQEVNVTKAREEIIEAEDLKKAKIQERQTSERSLEIAFHSQQIGSGSVLEVMQAKADLALSEDTYNEAQATWVMGYVNLLHAEGKLRELVN